MADRGEAGFSLIEALVALAVLAISAMSLLAAAQAHVARIAGLEWRTLARIAAENRMAELALAPSGDPGIDTPVVVEMLGRRFAVSVTRTATQDPDLDRIELGVRGGQGEAMGGFTGFLASPVAR